MSRKSGNVEFLKKLHEISGIKKVSAFSKACGKATPNMATRLRGTHLPGKKFLRSCAQNLFGWGVVPVMEVQPIPDNLNTIPKRPGVYVIYDSGANVLYVGKATDFRTEVRQALGRKIPVSLRFGPKLKKLNPKMRELAAYLSLYAVPSARLRHNMEVLLLRVFANQTQNSNVGRFK